MCGRFTLRANARAIAEAFELIDVPELPLRYNIAPTQSVAAIRLTPERGKRELAMLRWGLVPSWAEDPKIGYRLINARGETVATKPSFRKAFVERRCLIATDGFYEWQKTGATKQPYFIHRPDDAPFAFAGLWERWGTELLESCTIITTSANNTMKQLHDRMPVILSVEDWQTWLDPSMRDREKLEALLKPAPDNFLTAFPVSTVVNNARNNVPECVQPVS